MFKAAPSLGYFVRNGLAVGVGVGYEYMKDVNGHQNTFEVTPFLRYDFGGGRMRPFLLAESSFGWGKSDLNKGNDVPHHSAEAIKKEKIPYSYFPRLCVSFFTNLYLLIFIRRCCRCFFTWLWPCCLPNWLIMSFFSPLFMGTAYTPTRLKSF